MGFADYLSIEVQALDERIKNTYNRSSQLSSNLQSSNSTPNLYHPKDDMKEHRRDRVGLESFLPPLPTSTVYLKKRNDLPPQPQQQQNDALNDDIRSNEDDDEYRYTENNGVDRQISTLSLMSDMRREMKSRDFRNSINGSQYSDNSIFPGVHGLKENAKNPLLRPQRILSEEERQAQREKEKFFKLKQEILNEIYKMPGDDDKSVDNQERKGIVEEYQQMKFEEKNKNMINDALDLQRRHSIGSSRANEFGHSDFLDNFHYNRLDVEKEKAANREFRQESADGGIQSNRQEFNRPPTSYNPPQSFNQSLDEESSPIGSNNAFNFQNNEPKFRANPSSNAFRSYQSPYAARANPVAHKSVFMEDLQDRYSTQSNKQDHEESFDDNERAFAQVPTYSSFPTNEKLPEELSTQVDEMIENVKQGIEDDRMHQERDKAKVERYVRNQEREKPLRGYAKIAENRKLYQNAGNNRLVKKRAKSSNVEADSSNYGNANLTKPQFRQQNNTNSHFPYQSQANVSNDVQEEKNETLQQNDNFKYGMSTYPQRDDGKHSRPNSGTSGYSTYEGSEAPTMSAILKGRSRSVPNKEYMAGYNIADFQSREFQLRDNRNSKPIYESNTNYGYNGQPSPQNVMSSLDELMQRHEQERKALREITSQMTLNFNSQANI